jgi:hypothetical protein
MEPFVPLSVNPLNNKDDDEDGYDVDDGPMKKPRAGKDGEEQLDEEDDPMEVGLGRAMQYGESCKAECGTLLVCGGDQARKCWALFAMMLRVRKCRALFAVVIRLESVRCYCCAVLIRPANAERYCLPKRSV